MAVEFIASLVNGAARGRGLTADPGYPARMARFHEESGFDHLLVGQSSSAPDGLVVADQVLNATSHLGVLLAHRPGFVAPTVAARQYATLDAFHPGRVAMHVITGGDDADQLRDGDRSTKQDRYRRSDEFLDVVKLEWSSRAPFDYAGEFYQVLGGWSSVRPPGGQLPVYFAGKSAAAVTVGAKHADVYAFWGEPLAAIRQRMAEVRAATPPGRSPCFSAATTIDPAGVGSYEQVAEALLDYVRIGVTTLLIHGNAPQDDAVDYANIISLVRDQAEDREGVPA